MSAEQLENEEELPRNDVLAMSDEDIANMSMEEYEAKFGNQETEQEEDEDDSDEGAGGPVEEEEQPSEAPVEPSPYEGMAREPESVEAPVEAQESQNGIDYKAEYEKLMAPFKASGREIRVSNSDDAKRLMQMGVDYQKKMQALKPHLRIMKALEKNGLLDEEKVNFLIDLDQSKPKAVAKYFKEKEINPLEVEESEDVDYKPTSHAPSEKEMALDEVLDSIRETPSFQRTVDELGNRWDMESKNIFMQHPTLIKIINDHMEANIYDRIMDTVATERMLGRLNGMSDLAAYKQVGDALLAKGAFESAKPKQSAPESKSVTDPKRDARRRAASPTKHSATTGPKPDFNPLSISDEEFEKMAGRYYR